MRLTSCFHASTNCERGMANPSANGPSLLRNALSVSFAISVGKSSACFSQTCRSRSNSLKRRSLKPYAFGQQTLPPFRLRLTSLPHCLDALECPLFSQFGVLGYHSAEDIQACQILVQPQCLKLFRACGRYWCWSLRRARGRLLKLSRMLNLCLVLLTQLVHWGQ